MNESDEFVFLERKDIHVTNRRVTIKGTTYSLANITSVSKTKGRSNIGCAWILLIIGLLTTVGAIGMFFDKPQSVDATTWVVIGVCLLISLAIFKAKPTFNVVLTTSAGEQNVLSSQDEKSIDEVVSAIGNAIVGASK
jgi:hypothetical protein